MLTEVDAKRAKQKCVKEKSEYSLKTNFLFLQAVNLNAVPKSAQQSKAAPSLSAYDQAPRKSQTFPSFGLGTAAAPAIKLQTVK